MAIFRPIPFTQALLKERVLTDPHLKKKKRIVYLKVPKDTTYNMSKTEQSGTNPTARMAQTLNIQCLWRMGTESYDPS